MMRRWLYVIVILAMLVVPTQSIEIGRLQPVEVVMISVSDGVVRIETDTGNTGTGSDLKTAYEQMKAQASAEIFMDTADYLILTGDAAVPKEDLMAYLDPKIRVCTGSGVLDIGGAAAYLSVHKPVTRLRELNEQSALQTLTQKQTGFCLS